VWSSHYSATEVGRLAFEGPPPDASAMNRHWREIMEEAGRIIDRLPADEAGACVLTAAGDLFRGGPVEIAIQNTGSRPLMVLQHRYNICNTLPE